MGLVERCPDASDRRIVRVRITRRGRREIQQEYDRALKIFVRILETLKSNEQAELILAFEKIEKLLVKPSLT